MRPATRTFTGVAKSSADLSPYVLAHLRNGVRELKCLTIRAESELFNLRSTLCALTQQVIF